MKKDPFEEYLKDTEPNKRDKGYAWFTAIGLQAVDALKPSEYLVNLALKNIEGEITLEEAKQLLTSYYEHHPDEDERLQEADLVSIRITELLAQKAFSFSVNEYISIHKKLFSGIYKHAGKIRDYNISKKEWVLDGKSVIYASASELLRSLEYDLQLEKNFSYKHLSMPEIIHHLAVFVANLWQIHPFGEGNTRTTAVFLIKYLRTLGFDVTNDIFAQNAWYFRNALVRANYNNLVNGVHETTEYLELFLRNLLLHENNELRNRSMHVSGKFDLMVKDQPLDTETRKLYIEMRKTDIEYQKLDIETKLNGYSKRISKKTKQYAYHLYETYRNDIFGRGMIEKLLNIKSSQASTFIQLLLQTNVIEPISGHGKGKYIFVKK